MQPEDPADPDGGTSDEEYFVWLDATDSFNPILLRKESEAPQEGDDPASGSAEPTDT
jgi:hypothetical protein